MSHLLLSDAVHVELVSGLCLAFLPLGICFHKGKNSVTVGMRYVWAKGFYVSLVVEALLTCLWLTRIPYLFQDFDQGISVSLFFKR